MISNTTQASRLKRFTITLFFTVVVSGILIDTVPPFFSFMHPVKNNCRLVLNRLGLWQGSWTLFAPNPGIDNSWLSAEIYAPDGSFEIWSSPYWADTTSWQRFVSYRRMIFFTRLDRTNNKAYFDDFSDYIARTQIGSPVRPLDDQLQDAASNGSAPWKIYVSKNLLVPSFPEDEPLPPKEEVLWFANSRNLTIRKYEP